MKVKIIICIMCLFVIVLFLQSYRKYVGNKMNNNTDKEHINFHTTVVLGLKLDKGKKLLVSGSTEAAAHPDKIVIFPIKDAHGKWGYISIDGQIVIPPQFDDVHYNMTYGLLAVQYHGKWGYIDEYGNYAIPASYHFATPFSNGVAVVSNGKYCGCIDTNGNVVIPFKYSELHSFDSGAAWATNRQGRFGVINLHNETVLPFGKYENTILTYHHWYKEGLCFVTEGAYDPMGSNPISSYFVDNTGSDVLHVMKMDNAAYFDGGVCFVRVDKQWGLIDKKGKWIVNPIYDACYTYSDGFNTIARYSDIVTGFSSKDNIIGIDDNLPYVYTFAEGLALVEKNDKFGYVNRNGKVIIKPQYTDASFFNDGFAAVKIHGKYGYIDRKNTLQIKPLYDNASYFSEGIAPVKINGKYGCIDKHGKLVIKPNYQYIDIFRNGLALFTDGARYGYLDHSGKEIWSGENTRSK